MKKFIILIVLLVSIIACNKTQAQQGVNIQQPAMSELEKLIVEEQKQPIGEGGDVLKDAHQFYNDMWISFITGFTVIP